MTLIDSASEGRAGEAPSEQAANSRGGGGGSGAVYLQRQHRPLLDDAIQAVTPPLDPTPKGAQNELREFIRRHRQQRPSPRAAKRFEAAAGDAVAGRKESFSFAPVSTADVVRLAQQSPAGESAGSGRGAHRVAGRLTVWPSTEVSACSRCALRICSTVCCYRRLQPVLDPYLRPEQNGFRPHRGTVAQILALRQVIEEARTLGQIRFATVASISKPVLQEINFNQVCWLLSCFEYKAPPVCGPILVCSEQQLHMLEAGSERSTTTTSQQQPRPLMLRLSSEVPEGELQRCRLGGEQMHQIRCRQSHRSDRSKVWKADDSDCAFCLQCSFGLIKEVNDTTAATDRKQCRARGWRNLLTEHIREPREPAVSARVNLTAGNRHPAEHRCGPDGRLRRSWIMKEAAEAAAASCTGPVDQLPAAGCRREAAELPSLEMDNQQRLDKRSDRREQRTERANSAYPGDSAGGKATTAAASAGWLGRAVKPQTELLGRRERRSLAHGWVGGSAGDGSVCDGGFGERRWRRQPMTGSEKGHPWSRRRLQRRRSWTGLRPHRRRRGSFCSGGCVSAASTAAGRRPGLRVRRPAGVGLSRVRLGT
uniref:Reverse transcriptase domain-containing protein n=1 Tax=Macrostomum lignano TaxID=282301 RepID=A0A1I8FE10_9PLAT